MRPVIETLLFAYDDQLRAEGEIDGAESVSRLGPLWLAVFDDGERGHVTYRDLGGAVGGAVDDLILGAIAYFRDETSVSEFEWKTRGHDTPTDLGARLLSHDFVRQELETVMIGDAEALAVDVAVPEGVVVRRAGDGHDLRDDVERASPFPRGIRSRFWGFTRGFLRELAGPDSRTTLWIAEAEGQVVCSGRLRSFRDGVRGAVGWVHPPPVAQAGHLPRAHLGPGSVRDRARRPLPVQRLQRMSRPILERSGLYAVTTTTPYVWTRS